jgi:hypothetical protein
MVPKVTRLKWKLVSIRLETMLVLVQDWCMVLLDDDAQVEAHFGPFGDSGTLDAR